MPMKKEIWKPVVGFEGLYEISNMGRVKSNHKYGRPAKNGILRLQENHKGYLRAHLSGYGKGYTIVVHRLVLEAFVSPQPSAIHEGNHKNGIKSDNRKDNLEWVTPKENNRHAVENGFWHPHKGEAHGMAKLKASDIPIIRACEGKETTGQVAKRYGVTSTAIYTIWKRINWKHIPEEK
ncbi:hypothetical protein LCGC14_1579590 [marine sediment metagenome]|uniref:HNH nuclease domain-containing protein n=1 Tax=marine sediment metagenome TaxID=412755 RepID=A0A0F9J3D9_9ZZZZ